MKREAWLALLILLVPAAADAQLLGIRGGGTTEPAFAFGGVRIESTPSPEHALTFGATVDFGGGQQAATFVTGFFHVWLGKRWPTLEVGSWSPRFGLGLTYLYVHEGNGLSSNLGGSLALIAGIEHRSRISFEVQLNFQRSDVPVAYFVVGYRLH